jgi:hypothetical protein
MWKNHRCRTATSAGLIEGGVLDGVLTAAASLAPASGRFWKAGVRPPFSRAEVASFVVSAPVLLTETESLAVLTVLLAEGTSAPEPVGDGVGFEA